METTSLVTQSNSTTYDHQQVVKNKRKKFNPQYMLTNSSSDDDEGGGDITKDVVEDDDRDMDDGRRAETDKKHYSKISDAIINQTQSTNHHSINNKKKDQKNVLETSLNSSIPSMLSLLSPSKLSLIHSFQQQQQQLLQQVALSAIMPQICQENNTSSNLNESKFREMAYKTMQDFLNVYGFSLPSSDVLNIMKNQPEMKMASTSSSHSGSGLEPPTPPRTPVIPGQKVSDKNFNNNNDFTNRIFGEHSKDLNEKSTSESDYEISFRTSNNFRDDCNNSDEEGHQSVVSDMQEANDDGENSSGDLGSLDKFSLKNFDSFFDKSSLQNFLNPIAKCPGKQNDQSENKLIAEYSKYLTKYQSYVECRDDKCASENQREHYHCYDIQCYNKVLNKKEEIIRHLKWHKKRAESLNHGFLRFTSSDDCTIQYGYCQHNRKQTHYHCIQNKCDKVYISTSDVQMHSNYHRKDSAIYQEGFQRYRATEKCVAQHCIFYGQCTTHFHCRRCKYTFKNKADMEKHKTYHMKDEQLLKDGFKKFLKTEPCCVDGCRFTMICNHIHCIRNGCTYVLHSSGQLLSHKRKHERVDAEMAYRRFKMGQTAKDLTPAELSALQSFHGLDLAPKQETPQPINQFPVADQATTEKFNKLLNNATMENLSALLSHTSKSDDNVSVEILKEVKDQIKYSKLYSDSFENSDEMESHDDVIPKCLTQNISNVNDDNKSPTVEDVEKVITQYFTDLCSKQYSQDQPLDLNMKTSNKNILECFMSQEEAHLHCLITGCEAVVPRNLKDILEHLRMHELNRSTEGIIQNSNLMQITSIDGFFNRKRGRPPKNRVVEVYNNTQHPPQAIFTSFKLEKNDQKSNSSGQHSSANHTTRIKSENNNPSRFSFCKIRVYQPLSSCPDENCVYTRIVHYHCNISKACHYSTNHLTQIDRHINDFHKSIDILEGFEYFDRNFNCKKTDCCHNKISCHYHCLVCKVSFTMPSEMTEHICEKDIEENYENFDVIENELISSRQQNQRCSSKDESFDDLTSTTGKSRLSIKMQSPIENKYALNKDVDLIKTFKSSFYVKQENKDELSDKVVRAAGTWVPSNSDNEASRTSEYHNDFNHSSPTQSSDDSFCERPFCKLKRKPHEHCELCNQGFTDNLKLKFHYIKHKQTKLGESSQDENEHSFKFSTGNESYDASRGMNPNISNLLSHFQNQANTSNLMENSPFPNAQLANFAQIYQQSPFYYPSLYPFLNNPTLTNNVALDQLSLMQFPFPVAAMLQSNTNSVFDFTSNNLDANSIVSQKRKLLNNVDEHSSMKKTKLVDRPKEYQKKGYKDDSVPSGYSRYRFNQDCNFSNCGYRNHQSHFHCMRKECFYSFCDKTRFVQHTARHERLDKLMGDDFRQFRANMHCGYDNCAYNKNIGPHNKSSHFHCLRQGCGYICSDTNKVVAHRRQHTKQEYIKLAGFRKYSTNEHCEIKDPNTPDGECPYTLKQSHYHCLVCQMGVLSRNQLSFHNHRIRPDLPSHESLSQIVDVKLTNDQGFVILNDNGSDDNSC